jgi:hypothetical protein
LSFTKQTVLSSLLSKDEMNYVTQFANAVVILWMLLGTNCVNPSITELLQSTFLAQIRPSLRTHEERHDTFLCSEGLLPCPTLAASSLHNDAALSASGMQAAVYSVAEGPLAAALIAWQCAWVLGSMEHTTR